MFDSATPWTAARQAPLSTGFFKQEHWREGFPGGSVVKNRPPNAGSVALSPDPGRTRVPQSQLDPCSRAQELRLLRPVYREPALHKRGHCNEKPVFCNARKASAAMKTQHNKTVGWVATPLQGILPTWDQTRLLLCRQVLYHLRHQGGPALAGTAGNYAGAAAQTGPVLDMQSTPGLRLQTRSSHFPERGLAPPSKETPPGWAAPAAGQLSDCTASRVCLPWWI